MGFWIGQSIVTGDKKIEGFIKSFAILAIVEYAGVLLLVFVNEEIVSTKSDGSPFTLLKHHTEDTQVFCVVPLHTVYDLNVFVKVPERATNLCKLALKIVIELEKLIEDTVKQSQFDVKTVAQV